MKSNVKLFAALAIALVGVFGLTVISQLSFEPPKPVDEPDGGPAAASGMPLLFPTAEMKYEPTSDDLGQRTFDGFFEVSDREHRVGFWFRNVRPVPVELLARERSCSACTSAKAAAVTDEMFRQYAATAAVAGLPWGLAAMPDLLSPLAAAELDRKLNWTVFTFDQDKDRPITIPPAAGENRPTFGLVSVGFKALGAGPPAQKSATFTAGTPDGKFYPFTLAVTFAGQNPFGLMPSTPIDAGTMDAASPPFTGEILVLSTTRPPNQLPPPAAAVVPAGLVTFGPPAQLADGELSRLTEKVSKESNAPVRFRSGYRVPLTVRPEAGETAEIGPFTRDVQIAMPGTEFTSRVAVKGRMGGLVRLDGGEKIDLGSYNSDYSKKATAVIVADRADVELVLVPARCTPAFVQYSLDPPEVVDGKKRWTLKLSIPAKEGRRPAWDGVAFLQAKGAVTANVRLQVTGNGLGR